MRVVSGEAMSRNHHRTTSTDISLARTMGEARAEGVVDKTEADVLANDENGAVEEDETGRIETRVASEWSMEDHARRRRNSTQKWKITGSLPRLQTKVPLQLPQPQFPRPQPQPHPYQRTIST